MPGTESDRGTSAILLAGGYSARMGTDKAELPFGGVRLIEYQARRLRGLGIRDIVAAGYAGPVEGTRFVPDIYPHRGPLSGVHAGLCAIENPRALVLAVDTPLVPEALLRDLLREHQGGVTIAAHAGKTEPLIGVYDRALAPVCEELLRGGRTAMRKLLDRAAVRLVAYTGDTMLLANCNTPEDYRAICAFRGSAGRAEDD